LVASRANLTVLQAGVAGEQFPEPGEWRLSGGSVVLPFSLPTDAQARVRPPPSTRGWPVTEEPAPPGLERAVGPALLCKLKLSCKIRPISASARRRSGGRPREGAAMRWVTYASPADGADRAGVLGRAGVSGAPAGTTLAALAGRGTEGLAAAGQELLDSPAEFVPLDQAVQRAPVPVPPSIRDFMAFENHAVTSIEAIGGKLAQAWYEIPAFYFTNPAAVRGPRDPVEAAPGSSALDYELEVAAVIGEPGENIAVADAERHIAGFMLLCDWSARDLQEHEMAIGLGPAKGKDTATSFGPWMVTPDELADVKTAAGYDLAMTADVNGRRYSAGNWSTLYWTFAQLIAYASRGTTLRPGDVIGSGTVGTGCILELSRVHGSEAYPWLKAGDRVSLAVDRLGAIESVVLPAAEVRPLA